MQAWATSRKHMATNCFPVVRLCENAGRIYLDVLRDNHCTRKDVAALALSLNQDEWIVSGIGSGILVNDKYLALIKRDAGAPSNPSLWTITSGLLVDLSELTNRFAMYREAFEELWVRVNGQIMMPKFQEPILSRMASETFAVLNKNFPDVAMSEETFQANPVVLDTFDYLEVGGIAYRAIVQRCLPQKTINILGLLQYEIGTDATFEDGEHEVLRNGKKSLLHRKVKLFSKAELAIMDASLMTAHAREIIHKVLQAGAING